MPLSIRLLIRVVSCVALGALLSEAPPAGAQAPVPEGAEFQVNTYTTHRQLDTSVAADSDGDYIVVWVSRGSFGSDTWFSSIQGQRYASDGTAQGAQFQVNSYTTGDQFAPSVAAAPDGDFSVVWGNVDFSLGVFAKRYASDGSAVGGQFQINTYTTGAASEHSIAVGSDEDYVVVWSSIGSPGSDTSARSIQGGRFDSNGSVLGAQFQVNTYTTDTQWHPGVAAAADGSFVMVWESYGSVGGDSSSSSIQGQRYASDGSAVGAQFQVNSYTTSGQKFPSVGSALDGDFVVAWQSFGSSGTDTSNESIQAQRYASNGTARGAQFQVNSYTTGDQGNPSVAMTADERFVVSWHSNSSSGDASGQSIQAQHFASNGSPQGAQFQVNTYTTTHQRHPSVAAADGSFVVAWEGYGSSGTDTDFDSIHGQRYSVPPPEPPPVPALSHATRFALVAALLLLGATYAAWRRR
jgi:hypothetical protein